MKESTHLQLMIIIEDSIALFLEVHTNLFFVFHINFHHLTVALHLHVPNPNPISPPENRLKPLDRRLTLLRCLSLRETLGGPLLWCNLFSMEDDANRAC